MSVEDIQSIGYVVFVVAFVIGLASKLFILKK